jgi:hypothetical protein
MDDIKAGGGPLTMGTCSFERSFCPFSKAPNHRDRKEYDQGGWSGTKHPTYEELGIEIVIRSSGLQNDANIRFNALNVHV